MELTIIGALQVLIGLALLIHGSTRGLFVFVMVSTLFGGSAAIYLSALGGSSITPANFALAFLLLRFVLPGASVSAGVPAALRANVWLLVFVFYGAVAALLLPRIFAGEIDVTPLRGQVRSHYGSQLARILASEPLRFTSQNVTTAIYMTGTLALAIAAHAILSMPGGARLLARIGALIGMCHALLGFASVALRNTPANAVLDFLRNGSYAQLSHEWDGFVRMNGVWPEASSFAAYALVWFVFNFECWLRGVEARRTGPATLLLGTALVIGTSSGGYVGLALFAAIMLLRMLATPHLVPIDRLAWLTLAGLATVAGGCALLVLNPVLATAMRDLFEHMTFDKAGSFSGRQRLFWASQGFDAFRVSHGLGIGPGSFRSSSLVGAIIGSLGVIGVVSFIAHVWRAFRPASLSTWMPIGESDRDVAAAAAWAVLLDISIASISAPSCDPGFNFAILTGAAIALRGRSSNRPAGFARDHAVDTPDVLAAA